MHRGNYPQGAKRLLFHAIPEDKKPLKALVFQGFHKFFILFEINVWRTAELYELL